MTRFANSRACRSISLFLALVMLHAAPGLRVYEAVAQVAASRAAAGTAGAPIRLQLPVNAIGAAAIAAPASLSAASLFASPSAAAAPAQTLAAASAAAPATLAKPAVLAAASPAAAASISHSAAAPATVFAAASRLLNGNEAAVRVPAAAAPALDGKWNRTFDGSRDIKEEVSAAVSGAASAGDALRLSAAALNRAAAPSVSVEPPSAPQGPAASPRGRVAVGLGLAAIGAVAAFFTAPWIAAVAGGLLAGHVVVSALTIKAVWIGLGVMAGFSAYNTQTWKNFPNDLANSSKTAAGTTFRFWGRFGLIFNAVLRGRSTDEATKAELPLNILSYPLIAWPAVVAGYVLAPVAFLLGAGYQLVGTPVLAGLRGLREVVVGFFPWLSRVFRFVGRLIIRSAPFVGGLVIGALRTTFIAGAAGAGKLAGPVIRDAAADYESKTFPGTVVRFAMIGVGYASALVLGALGFAMGVVSSPLTILFGGLQKAFDWSNIDSGASKFFKLWWTAMNEDKGLNALVDRRFPAARVETMGARVVRTANGIAMSLLETLSLPFVSLGAFVRATASAIKGVEVPEKYNTFGDGVITNAKERPVESTPGLIIPIALAVVGAAGGLYAFATLGAAYFALSGLSAVAAYAASTIIGAGLGLAASQPKAFRNSPSDIGNGAVDGARLAWGGWTSAASLVVAAVTGVESKTAGNVVGAVPGATAAVGSFVLGGAYEIAAAVEKASWSGLISALHDFLPFLRRAVAWAGRVLRRAVPYAGGLIIGTVVGVVKNAAFGAISLLRPIYEVFDREQAARHEASGAQASVGVLLMLSLVAPALAVGAAGVVLGAVVGLPFALISGVAQAGEWANVGPKSKDFYSFWNRTFLPRVAARASEVNRGLFPATEAGMPVWRAYVSLSNSLLGAAPAALAMTTAAIVAAFDGKNTAAASSSVPSAAPAPSASPASSVPAKRTPTIIVALAGLVGLGLGALGGGYVLATITFFSAVFGVPFLGGLTGWHLAVGVAAAFGLAPVIGASTGLALSQLSFWKNVIPNAAAQASAGAKLTYQYWSNSGEASVAAVLAQPRGPSVLALPHKAAGVVHAVSWGAAGAVFGAAAAFGRAALDGSRQVVEQFLPFLKWAYDTILSIGRHFASFGVGLVAGSVSGVIGSAAFGALLLGRPYFKHVVAADSQWSGALGFLGMAVLKISALVAGIVFGVLGAVAGTIVAAPYALTGAAAFAFRFAGIGGPVQKFLDHWTYGTLPQELKRINQLTNRFQFPDGDVTASTGWIRMANILPATIAASVAGTIAGAVGYLRSLKNAYVATRDGKPVPASFVDADPASSAQWRDTWRSSKKAALSVLWAPLLGGAAGLAAWLLFSWAPLGFTGWFLVGVTAALGATLSLTLAGGIAAVALIYWISGQLN